MYNFLKTKIADAATSVVVGVGDAIGDSVRAVETVVFWGYTIVVTPVKVAYGTTKYFLNSWKVANSVPSVAHNSIKNKAINVANKFASFLEKSVIFLSVNSAIKSHYASVISDKTGIAEGTISKFAPVVAHMACKVSGKFYLDMALVSYSGYVNVKEDSEASYSDYLYSALFASVMTYGVSKITYAYPLYHLKHVPTAIYYVVNKNDPDYDINYYDVASKVLSDAANPETFAMTAYKLAIYANPQISWAMSLGVAVSSYLSAEYYESSKNQDTYTPCLPSLELLGLCGDGNQDDDLVDV